MIEHIIFPVFVFCEHSGEANVLPGQLLRLFLAYSTNAEQLARAEFIGVLAHGFCRFPGSDL